MIDIDPKDLRKKAINMCEAHSLHRMVKDLKEAKSL